MEVWFLFRRSTIIIELYYIGFVGTLILVGMFFGITLLIKKLKLLEKEQVTSPTQVHINLKPLEDKLGELPNKVLQSITASANNHKGAIGELIGYIQLRSSYDRIIPLGNIVDFMCISFPKEGKEGHVDFIDIKTGNQSRLSKDQRELKKLIEDKNINFIKLKVDTTHNENSS